MLTSSPYSLFDDAFHSRRVTNPETNVVSTNPLHPATRSRITLFECLESRGYVTAFEINLPAKLALVWDLVKRERVTEVKLDENRNICVNADVPNIVATTKQSYPYLRFMLHQTQYFDWMNDISVIACKGPDIDIVSEQPTVAIHKRRFQVFELNRSDVMCIFWPLKPYTKTQLDEICLHYLIPKVLQSVMVVSEQAVKPQCSVIFQHRGIDCTFFSYDDLKFNITKHLLVPRYKVIPHDQLTEVGIQPIDIYRLPTMLRSDPVCLFFGWKDGTVLQIQTIAGKPAPEFRVVRPVHTFKPYQPMVAPIYPVATTQSDKKMVNGQLDNVQFVEEKKSRPQTQGHISDVTQLLEDYYGPVETDGFNSDLMAQPMKQTNIREFLRGNWQKT